jgi:protein TonB
MTGGPDMAPRPPTLGPCRHSEGQVPDVSRAGDAIALAVSAALHAALFAGALLVAWPDDIRPATILLVDLLSHALESRPVDPPRPVPPRPTPVPPVARQAPPPAHLPVRPSREVPPEIRERQAAQAPRPPEKPALEAVADRPSVAASGASPAVQPSGASRASDIDAAAAGVAVPSATGATSGPSVAAIPAPSPPEQITQAAQPRGGYQVRPVYPEAARQAGVEGTTLLRVRISMDGRVDDVQVQRSAGHAALDRAAVEAVRKWRFEPARNGSVAVVPVEFRLKNDF